MVAVDSQLLRAKVSALAETYYPVPRKVRVQRASAHLAGISPLEQRHRFPSSESEEQEAIRALWQRASEIRRAAAMSGS